MIALNRGWKLAALIVLGAAVLVLGGWLIAYVIDSNSHSGRVMRNVTLTFPDGRYEDVGIGGLSESAMRDLLAEVVEEYASRPVTLQMESGDQTLTMGDLGFGIDLDRTISEAMRPGRIGNFFERAGKWVGSMFEAHRTQVYYFTDLNSEFLADAEDIVLAEPEDAKLVSRGPQRSFRFAAGENGAAICGDDIAQSLRRAADPFADEITVSVSSTELPARTSNDNLARQIELLNQATSRGLAVRSAGTSHSFSAAEVRSWLEAELEVTGRQVRTCADLRPRPSSSAALSVSLASDEAIRSDMEERFADDIVPGDFGTITIIDGRPTALDPSPGSRCCAPFDTDAILHALFAEPAAGSAATDASAPPSVSVPVRVDPDLMPDFEADGEIREIVGEFTTNHRPDIPSNPQPRVTNIQRFADLVRGAVIQPGETFSLNDHVGERTEEKGFVEAGVIYRGVFTEDVGGGVSQFATTFFSAAFFAGLDFLEYQSHTLYISRYPYGREATISWPYVDLVVQNNTPYPMLLWPTYTADSITVSIYSTEWAESEQTDQVAIAEGECVRVHTERTRTFPDGSETADRVTALYRPSEGINCAGDPEVPLPDCAENEIGIDTDDDKWPDACQPCPAGQVADRSRLREDVCVREPEES